MRREIAIAGIAIAGVTLLTPEEQARAACPTTVLSFKDSGGTVQTLCFGGASGAFIPQYQILDSAGTNALSVNASGQAAVSAAPLTVSVMPNPTTVTTGSITIGTIPNPTTVTTGSITIGTLPNPVTVILPTTTTITTGNITITGQTLTVTNGAITITGQTLTMTTGSITIGTIPNPTTVVVTAVPNPTTVTTGNITIGTMPNPTTVTMGSIAVGTMPNPTTVIIPTTTTVTTGNITLTAQTVTVTVGNMTITGQTLTVTAGAITITGQTLTITSTAIAISGVPTVQAVPATSGGLSVCASATTATATTCKNTAGQIYGWALSNPNTTQEYIQIFDSSSATSVTLGTTVAKFQFLLPAGAAANVFGDIGITCVSGIVYAATTLRGGSSSPTTALDINFFYK